MRIHWTNTELTAMTNTTLTCSSAPSAPGRTGLLGSKPLRPTCHPCKARSCSADYGEAKEAIKAGHVRLERASARATGRRSGRCRDAKTARLGHLRPRLSSSLVYDAPYGTRPPRETLKRGGGRGTGGSCRSPAAGGIGSAAPAALGRRGTLREVRRRYGAAVGAAAAEIALNRRLRDYTSKHGHPPWSHRRRAVGARRPVLDDVRRADQAALYRARPARRPRSGDRAPGGAPLHARCVRVDVPRAVVDDAPVRGIRHRAGDQSAFSLPAGSGSDGALDGVRHAVADGPRLRSPALARRGRAGGGRDRHGQGHGCAVRGDPA